MKRPRSRKMPRKGRPVRGRSLFPAGLAPLVSGQAGAGARAAVLALLLIGAPGPPGRAAEAPSLPLLREAVEADISTRAVAITPSFAGIEIIVFGAVRNSRQETPDAGLYDVAVVVEGMKGQAIVRRKSNAAGLWINTEWAAFDAPSYYAVATTRPLSEIAPPGLIAELAIGFGHVPVTLQRSSVPLTGAALTEYRHALVRLKQADKLYVRDDYGVSFIGRSLFRTSADLPANVPVGPLRTRIYLFRDGQLLSQWHSGEVRLERAGLESILYMFAVDYPVLYGLFAVVLAAATGLLVSALFRRT